MPLSKRPNAPALRIVPKPLPPKKIPAAIGTAPMTREELIKKLSANPAFKLAIKR
jgi:hypothetical protein